MSALKDLAYDIEQLYIEGFNSRAIANELNCSIELVLGALEAMNVADSPQEELSPYETFNS
jgi:orotate phosphoribosyltransferase-like protein